MDFYLPSGSSSSGSSSSGSSSGVGGGGGSIAATRSTDPGGVTPDMAAAIGYATPAQRAQILDQYKKDMSAYNALITNTNTTAPQQEALRSLLLKLNPSITSYLPGTPTQEQWGTYNNSIAELQQYITNPTTIPGWTTQDDVLASGNSGSWINADGTAGKTMVNAAKPEATTGGMLPPADMVFTDPTPEEVPPSDLPTGWKDGYTEDLTTGGPGLPIAPVAPADKLKVGLLGLDFTKPLNWKTDNFNTPYPSLSSLNTQTAQQTKPTTEKQDQFQWQRQDVPESAKFGTDYLKNYAESNKSNLAWQAYA